MVILLICSAIVAAVIIFGTATKTNIGLWAIFAAYVLGAFVLGVKPSIIIAMWPTKLFLMLFAVTFFYSFAILNGSLEKLSLHAVYLCRSIPWAIPIMLYLLGFILSGIGAGDGAIVLLIPAAMSIAKITGMNYFLAATSTICGISYAGATPISTIGIFIRELMELAGYSPEAADGFANKAFFHGFIVFTLVFILSYIIFRGYRVKADGIKRPEPFEGKQKITLGIISLYVCVMVLVPLLHLVFPENPVVGLFAGNLNIALVSFFFALVSILARVGDEKKAFLRVPWSALMTLCGMSMLISIVTESGTVETISNYLSSNVSDLFSPTLFALFSGIMSFFVSGFVVNTTFFPLVPGVAAGGMDPGLLFSAIAVGAMGAAVSPFSSMGAMAVSLVDDEKKRPAFFIGMILWAGINIIIYSILLLLISL
ncbi:MAG: SLC13 family permease [Acidobacteriota bacterium]|jgi:di/tricarboxylate transporter